MEILMIAYSRLKSLETYKDKYQPNMSLKHLQAKVRTVGNRLQGNHFLNLLSDHTIMPRTLKNSVAVETR